MRELISHPEFGRLRLADFASSGFDIAELEGWEYEEDEWVGEAIGFSEWLRLAEDPQVLRSLALELDELPLQVVQAVLTRLNLPLHRGMSAEAADALFGKPLSVSEYGERHTRSYGVGTKYPYTVSCTFKARDGLTYLTVKTPTPRRLATRSLARRLTSA